MIADQETGEFYFIAKAARRFLTTKDMKGQKRIHRKGREGRKENLAKRCLVIRIVPLW